MIPPQHIVVTCSPAEDVADYWATMTEAAPDHFNAWFVLARGVWVDD